MTRDPRPLEVKSFDLREDEGGIAGRFGDTYRYAQATRELVVVLRPSRTEEKTAAATLSSEEDARLRDAAGGLPFPGYDTKSCADDLYSTLQVTLEDGTAKQARYGSCSDDPRAQEALGAFTQVLHEIARARGLE